MSTNQEGVTVRVLLTGIGVDVEQQVASGTKLRTWSEAAVGGSTLLLVNGKAEPPEYVFQDRDELSLSPKGVQNAAEEFADGTPWPEIMTPEEAARALRLDVLSGGDMEKALAALTRLVDVKKALRPSVYAGAGGGKRMYTIKAVRECILSL